MRKWPVIISATVFTTIGAPVDISHYIAYYGVDYIRKAEALRNSATWYIPDINVADAEGMFDNSLFILQMRALELLEVMRIKKCWKRWKKYDIKNSGIIHSIKYFQLLQRKITNFH